ncbi:MAG: GAF domain-containing protein [Anaerolineales bacterium]|nr:GAF domain-containing protein [Anaerolineales bacterium]MDW8276912.1 GAF domain-containing protein [Anaerolineales bacterium]
MVSSTTTNIVRLNEAKRIRLFYNFTKTLHELVNLPVGIWIPDKQRRQLRLAAFQGVPMTLREDAVVLLNEADVIADVFRARRAEVVSDILREPRWKHRQQALAQGWVAALCVPIVVNGQAEGVMTVYAGPGRTGNLTGLKTLVENFVNQIALTIEVENRRVVLEALMYISQKYETVSDNLREILQAIVNASAEVLGADCVVLYPFDAEREMYYDRAHVVHHGLLEPLELSEKPRVKWSMANQVMREGELVVADLAAEYPERMHDHFIVREGVRAFMAIAPRANNQPLGLLFINYRTPHRFSEEEKNAIRLFAHQAGIAIHNAQLFRRSQRQAQALKELHEIGSGFLSLPYRRKLKDVLDEVAHTALKALGADLVDLYHYNEEEDRFLLPPSLAGNRSSPSPKAIHKDDVLYQLFEARIPLYITDAQRDPRTNSPFLPNRPADTETRQRFVVRERIQSTAAIPLMIDGKTVGALFINYRMPQTFPQHQRELIEIFAAEAAIAIANISLYESSQKRAEALSRLNSVSENLIQLSEGSADLPRLLKQVAEGALEVLDADLVDLYQYEQNRNRYPMPVIEAGNRYQPVLKDRVYRTDIAYAVVELGRPQYFHDTMNEPALTRPHEGRSEAVTERFVVREKIQSMAAVPMKIGNEIVGVLFVSYRQRQAFSRAQKELIELYAAQTALAIRNARLLIRRKALVESGNLLASQVTRSERELLHLVYEQVDKFMDSRNLTIVLCDTGRDEFRPALVIRNGEKLVAFHWESSPEWRAHIIPILNSRDAVFSSRRAEIDSGHIQPEQVFFSSWIGAPMLSGDRVLGAIVVYHERENTYTFDDKSVLQTIANQTAAALENMRLYNQARAEVLAERQLATLGRAMAALEHRINNTLSMIPPNLARLRNRLDTKDEELEEILGIIERNARYTATLLKRIRAPLLEVRPEEVDINALVRDIFEQQRREWTADRTRWLVEASIETAPDLPPVHLPKGQLSEVFHNLIQNGYRALEKAHRRLHTYREQLPPDVSFGGAKIHVWTALEDGKICVRVKDNVPGGIPSKILSRLFEKPVSPVNQDEGSGLGLWLSKMIMTSLGGDIRIESTGLLGTTMLVEIPLPHNGENHDAG